MPTAVLLSGGLDSAVLLAEEAARDDTQPIYVSVGLAWERAEQEATRRFLESAAMAGRVRPLASRFFLPGFLVRDPFDTLAALARFRGPLLVLHGRDDTIIPPAHGRALAAAVPGAVFHELPCGHNDCPRAWTFIARFLQQVT